MGSHDFRVIISEIRQNFLPGEEDITDQLFEYFDKTGDCLLVLAGKDARTFNAFRGATDRMLAVFPTLRDEVGDALIEELLALLQNDPRANH